MFDKPGVLIDGACDLSDLMPAITLLDDDGAAASAKAAKSCEWLPPPLQLLPAGEGEVAEGPGAAVPPLPLPPAPAGEGDEDIGEPPDLPPLPPPEEAPRASEEKEEEMEEERGEEIEERWPFDRWPLDARGMRLTSLPCGEIAETFNVFMTTMKTDATNGGVWQNQKIRSCRVLSSYYDIDKLAAEIRGGLTAGWRGRCTMRQSKMADITASIGSAGVHSLAMTAKQLSSLNCPGWEEILGRLKAAELAGVDVRALDQTFGFFQCADSGSDEVCASKILSTLMYPQG
ncbi:unnamed protein product, partial [Prorocentrum cordatum]